MMKLSHEEYLKQTLKSKKAELEVVQIEHKIAIGEYNTKVDMLRKQIYSIEDQLESADK